MDLAVLLENRFPPVRVRGRGNFILYFILFCLEVQGSQKKYNIVWRIPAAGGVPAPIFLWRPPLHLAEAQTRRSKNLSGAAVPSVVSESAEANKKKNAKAQ